MPSNKKNVARLLKTARGQMDGILKMIEEERYCIDISNQIMATQSILKKANQELIKEHMNCCVKEAILDGNEEEKINEIIALLNKIV